MPFATLGDIEIWYERGGEGEPLLFISGTGSDLRTRPGVFDGPFPKAFDVLAWDQRGLGRSSKPDRPYAMADYADDAAKLMAHVGWESALVLGASFGGMVAQELALRHPGRVRRLVLACTSPGGQGGASYPFHDMAYSSLADRARQLVGVADVRRDADWARRHPAEFEAIVALGAADPFADEPGHAMGARRQLEARAGHDAWDRLGRIVCPVLIAAGRHDGIALPRSQENMAARIPGAELRFFEGGHLFMLQDREAIPAMIAFLNG